MSNSDDLSALNRQVTDEDGKIKEDDTSQEEPETLKQTTEEEDATAEKPAESKESSPEETKETENEPEMVETASDETGKRYVPESRFKKIYAKGKAAERENKELKHKLEGFDPQVKQPAPTQAKSVDRVAAIEIEQLRSTMPQFNPDSEEYSRDLDEMAYDIYTSKMNLDANGDPVLTMVQAGRRAMSRAKKITSKVADIKVEAKSVKAQQSDQGITNRVLNRKDEEVDPEKMTLEEKEEWLKANNAW